MMMRTSMRSPRRASPGTWIFAVIVSAPVEAGGFVDLDVRCVEPETSVRELRDRRHPLGAVQTDARLDLGTTRLRAEEESRHERDRAFLRNEIDTTYVVRLAHWAVDSHGHRHRMSV